MQPEEELSEDLLVEPQSEFEHEIILYNDDVNTFEHVIQTLIIVCDHTPEQAEQCSLIVHYKGKCAVKSGSYEELEPICLKLLAAGLSAEIV
jgi:ATP-dependent Clp protease adaptor protein ClpS